MTYTFGTRIEDVEDRLNEFLELVHRPRSRSSEKGLYHFEHTGTAEDASSVESQQPWNI